MYDRSDAEYTPELVSESDSDSDSDSDSEVTEVQPIRRRRRATPTAVPSSPVEDSDHLTPSSPHRGSPKKRRRKVRFQPNPVIMNEVPNVDDDISLAERKHDATPSCNDCVPSPSTPESSDGRYTTADGTIRSTRLRNKAQAMHAATPLVIKPAEKEYSRLYRIVAAVMCFSLTTVYSAPIISHGVGTHYFGEARRSCVTMQPDHWCHISTASTASAGTLYDRLCMQASVYSTTYSYTEAMEKDRTNYWPSILEEWNAMWKFEAFEWVPRSALPYHAVPIPMMWLCTQKSDGRYKSRLVARGDKEVQAPGTNNYAPSSQSNNIRLTVAHAVARDWHMTSIDISNAFLQSKISPTEHIYMLPPEGFTHVKPGHVLRLRRALYGLRGSPRKWWETFAATLHEFGLEEVESDQCTLIRKNGNKVDLVCELHVDDLLITGTRRDTKALINFIQSKYETREYSVVDEFLGIQFRHDAMKGVTLHQSRYISDLAQKFLSAAERQRPVAIPMLPGTVLPLSDTEPDLNVPYLQLVGALVFLSCSTRPDITHCVMELSKHNCNFTSVHYAAARRVLQYLFHHRNLGLHYRAQSMSEFRLRAYSDSDYAKAVTGHSITGWVVTLGGTAIAWQSAVQGQVAVSVFEAEYHALASTFQASRSLQLILNQFLLPTAAISCACDNKHVVDLTVQGRIHTRRSMRHVRMHFGYLWDILCRGFITLFHIKSTVNPADMFTKPLAASVRSRHCSLLGIA